MFTETTASPLSRGPQVLAVPDVRFDAFDAVTFVAALYAVARLPAMSPEGGSTRAGCRSLLGGIRFVARSKVLTAAFLTDLNAMALAMPIALFPAVNAERFGGAEETLGLLVASVAAGGVLGSVLSGPVGRVSRQGRGMLIAGAVWGAGLVGFGLAHDVWLASALLVVAGTADVLSVIFCASLVQLVTPDGYRGRVAAVEYMIGVGGPQLGNFRAGVVGSLTSPAISVVSGGLCCLAGAALIRFALPAFARYRHRAATAHGLGCSHQAPQQESGDGR